ncbi:hypothetical protein MMC07_007672 [Pseudocyphellaria aurata]|nr:hypothetical protein [Pseudocyphellaria aurata]
MLPFTLPALKLAGFVAFAAVVGWCWPDRKAQRLVPSTPLAHTQPVDEELGFSALASESDSPDTSFDDSALSLESPPRPEPAQPAKKAKKTVGFDLARNEVYEVDYWFDRRIHKHREIRFGWGIEETIEVSRWIEPDGHNQLHFPRTKWVRDVPDWTVEDQDGDVEMLDD